MAGVMGELMRPEGRCTVEFDRLGRDPLVDRRHDVKSVLDETRLARLVARVPDDWQVITAGGSPVQLYHTVYFDTPDLRLFRDHRQGRLRRYKVRTRRYPDGTVMLELKLRGPKRLTQKIRRSHGEHGTLAPTDIAWVASELERTVAQPAPDILAATAWTRYARTVLRAPDGTERLTIDRRLETGIGTGTGDAMGGRRGAIIVELKSLAPRSALLPALHAAGARPLRLSKYAVAVHGSHEVHANRWLPALRRLETAASPAMGPFAG